MTMEINETIENLEKTVKPKIGSLKRSTKETKLTEQTKKKKKKKLSKMWGERGHNY